MTTDEKRQKKCAELWVKLFERFCALLAEKKMILEKSPALLAITCAKILTGNRNSRLFKRINAIEDKGKYGEHVFKALAGMRLHKAEMLIEDICEHLCSVEGMSAERLCVVIPAIESYFQKGYEAIQKYQGGDRDKLRLQGPGVRVVITNGTSYVLSEIVPDSLLGIKTVNKHALMVLAGKYTGAVATVGKLGDLYRIIFPEDASTFEVAEHFFWNPDTPAPSTHSKKAEVVAENFWMIDDEPKISKNPGVYGAFTQVKDQYKKPVKFITNGQEPVWKKHEPFHGELSRVYSSELASEDKDEKPKQFELDLDKKEEPEKNITKYPTESLPESMKEFREEYSACDMTLATNFDDFEKRRKLESELEEHELAVESLRKELSEWEGPSDDDVAYLKTLQKRWNDMYSVVPKIAETSKDRLAVVNDIEGTIKMLEQALGSI